MKKMMIEINGHEVKIMSKNCAKIDEAIALRAFLCWVKDSGISSAYLERYLDIKFAKTGNSNKLEENDP